MVEELIFRSPLKNREINWALVASQSRLRRRITGVVEKLHGTLRRIIHDTDPGGGGGERPVARFDRQGAVPYGVRQFESSGLRDESAGAFPDRGVRVEVSAVTETEGDVA